MPAGDQPPSQLPPEPALLTLARKKFATLSRAEEELFRSTQEGRVASVLTDDESENNPANAANWNPDRVVRGGCIAWLCTDPQALALVTYRGLQLLGMRIDADLEVQNAEIKFPLTAWKCAFSGNFLLRDAQLRGLYLVGCLIKSLSADRARIRGAVLLRDGFKAEGEVNLLGATIDGYLDCTSAQFSNATGFALNANGAKVEGGVFLRDGFKPDAEVNLLGATIGGGLDCTSAQFSNAKGFALNANGAKVEGGVFLRSGFKAEGEVNLLGATIGGGLDCSSAQFSNAKSTALTAEGAKIGGDVFLRDGFKADGGVNLLNAMAGALLIYNVLEAEKILLDLRLTKVQTFWDDEKSWPKSGMLLLDGFRYERLYEKAPLSAESRKKWLRRQPHDKFLPQPYEQLAAVLRQMGHEREARLVMIEKNHQRASFTRFPRQGWWWFNLFGRFIGYGYAPWRAFALSVAIILLGWFVFYLGFAHHLFSPTKDNAYVKAPNGHVVPGKSGGPEISKDYPVFNPLVYSLESFIPLIKFDQSASWTPNANSSTEISTFHLQAPTGRFLRYYLYFHIAAGWLFTSLWVGAVTGLVKS